MHSFVLQLCVSVESKLHKVFTLTLAAISPEIPTSAQAINFSQSNPSALLISLALLFDKQITYNFTSIIKAVISTLEFTYTFEHSLLCPIGKFLNIKLFVKMC